MNTVTFGEYNSFEHLDLILNSKTIGAAMPKLLAVDNTGGNGELDYTDYFGAVNYKNRPLSFEFSAIGNHKEFLQQYSRIQNLLNGRKMKVTLSDDPDFYYIGRVTVNDWKTEKAIGKLVIDVNAEPYKLKHAHTVIYTSIKNLGLVDINCPNLKKAVSPKISFVGSGAQGNIVWGGECSDTLYAGDIPAEFAEKIVFTEGDNLITVIPARQATFPFGVRVVYQEGGL